MSQIHPTSVRNVLLNLITISNIQHAVSRAAASATRTPELFGKGLIPNEAVNFMILSRIKENIAQKNNGGV